MTLGFHEESRRNVAGIPARGASRMNIDVVDVTDPRLMQTKLDLEKLGTSTVLTYCAMSNGMNQMVYDIMKIAPPHSVQVLRIWAHGTPSVVGISSGDDPRLIRQHLTGISPGAF